MDPLTSGTFVGAGSFCCRQCGYTLTLSGTEPLSDCPMCQGRDFVRASLFSTERIATSQDTTIGSLAPAAPEWGAALARARASIDRPGEYLIYDDDGEPQTVPLTREWTRIGRSLAADVRFDDPTVSRRHALVVRQHDGVRLLDDRSLNGVFVNGARVEGRALQDGDEIVVGRYRLMFVRVAAESEGGQPSQPGGEQLRTVG